MLIDYRACRRALISAIALAVGLPREKIIRANPTGPADFRPELPYATFETRIASMRSGRDAVTYAPDVGENMWRYVGDRGMAIDINFYADDIDDAYGMAATMQGAFYHEDVKDALGGAGFAVTGVSDVTDVSALLGTGFEPRALVSSEMWLGVEALVSLGSIETVLVEGEVFSSDAQKILDLSLNATLGSIG